MTRGRPTPPKTRAAAVADYVASRYVHREAAIRAYTSGVTLARDTYKAENKSAEDERAEKAIRAARDKRRREARKSQ